MQDDHGIRRVFGFSWVYNAFQSMVGATKARRWVCERFWQVKAGQRIVDIGCGPGTIVPMLPPGIKYVGFDISDKYIASARSKYSGDPDKTFIVGVAEHFADNPPELMREADLVIINGLLHHLSDVEAWAALTLARDSLSPTGKLVCLEACFLISQPLITRWVLSLDRGKNVRTEPEWKALFSKVFDRVDSYILTGLLRIPYTLIVIEARR